MLKCPNERNGRDVMTWKLQTVVGDYANQEVLISQDTLVGRHQDANLLIQSADISRRHAVLLVKDQTLFVQDQNSSNGTFVNEKRIGADPVQLSSGDVVQFASHPFTVLFVDMPLENTAETKHSEIQQPAEAIATSEVTTPTPAAQMLEQGMPDLKERDTNVHLSKDGMPQNIGIPKPAPIPAGIDLNVKAEQPEACKVDIPETCAVKEAETQQNAKIGLISLLVIIAIALVVWFLFQ